MAHVRKIEKAKRGPNGKVVTTVRYYTQVYLGKDPATGKTRWQTKTFAREKDAEAWATKIEGKRNEGSYRPTLSKATFADYLRDTWLPWYGTQIRSTYDIEKGLAKWVLRPLPDTPFLGKKKLRDLTPTDFNNFYVALTKRGMSQSGIEHLHGLLRRALKHAVGTEQLPRNPTDGVTPPRPERRREITSKADERGRGKVKYLSPDQARRFLAAADRDRYRALWRLLLDSGLRPGEAFALKWYHVDFERGVVMVRTTLGRLRGAEREGREQSWIITEPKTEASDGDVPLAPKTIKALRAWQAEQRLQVGPTWSEDGFVFTTELGTPVANNIGRAWDRVLRSADGGLRDLGTWGPEPKKPRTGGRTPERSFKPRFSMYVLRHTCATLLLLGGMPLLQVSRRLRHKNIYITAEFYGHVGAEHTTQASEIWERLEATAS